MHNAELLKNLPKAYSFWHFFNALINKSSYGSYSVRLCQGHISIAYLMFSPFSIQLYPITRTLTAEILKRFAVRAPPIPYLLPSIKKYNEKKWTICII